MASVGEKLTSPEEGWKRIDNTSPLIKYNYSQGKTHSTEFLYGGTQYYSNEPNASYSFKFYGTQFRIIEGPANNRADGIQVIVDGKLAGTYDAYQPDSVSQFQVIIFEQLGLPLGVHTVEVVKPSSDNTTVLSLDAIDIDDTGYLVSQVGVPLTSPEVGWRRYDSNSNLIKYSDASVFTPTNASSYGGTVHYGKMSAELTFFGTKLRLIVYNNASASYSRNVQIEIDGTVHNFDCAPMSGIVGQVLAFEISGLEQKFHQVVLNKDKQEIVNIDAIDIDDTGYLLAPVGTILKQPEQGWTRYDNVDARINYTGSWSSASNSYLYGGSHTTTREQGGKYEFSFKGTAFRLIDYIFNNRSKNIKVIIDGQEEYFSGWGPNGTIGGTYSQAIAYQKLNLSDSIHKVTVELTDTDYLVLDAIDIMGEMVLTEGAPLKGPTPGWNRYDNTFPGFKYEGTDWTTESTTSASNNSIAQTLNKSDSIKFYFDSEKIRVIALSGDTDFANEVELLVDGVVLSTFSLQGNLGHQQLVAEVGGISTGVTHSAQIRVKPGSEGILNLDAIDILNTGFIQVIPTINTSVKAPLEGWKRYDDRCPQIVYEPGKWVDYSNNSGDYNGRSKGARKNVTAWLEFSFLGTSFALITYAATSYSRDVPVYVDGVYHGDVEAYLKGASQNVSYTVTGLEHKIHHVRMEVNSTHSSVDTYNLRFDAIDIDKNGMLMHPDEVLSLSDLTVGKRIRCYYRGETNSLGSFSHLGKEVYVDGINDFISLSGSSTPRGCFYLVATSYNKSILTLMASSNIQHSISPNTLSAAGILQGVQSEYIISDEIISRTDPSVTYSSNDSAIGYEPELGFNDGLMRTNASRVNAAFTNGVYIQAAFSEPRNIRHIGVQQHTTVAACISKLIVEYSDDGTSFATAAVLSVTKNGVKQYYNLPDVGEHFFWRVRAGENGTTSSYYWYIGVDFFENTLIEGKRVDITVPSGGTSIVDVFNDWDNFVTYPAAQLISVDWNAITASSITATPATDTQTVYRGGSSGIQSRTNVANTSISTAQGFRPLFRILDLSSNEYEAGTLFEVESGLVYVDEFDSLHSRWVATPPNGYSLTERPGYIRLKHNASVDTMILGTKPAGNFAFEVIADYTPTAEGDEGGLVLWDSANDKLEFLESSDHEISQNQIKWLAVYEEGEWSLYSDAGSGYQFVDTSSIEATRYGVVVKRGASSNFVPLDVNTIYATRGDKLEVRNVRVGQKVELVNELGKVIASGIVAEGEATIKLRMPTLQVEGTIKVYDEEGVVKNTISGIFHGGDIYRIGSSLQVRKDGVELSKVDQTSLGSLTQSSALEVKLEIYNPYNLSINNIKLSIVKYAQTEGWKFVDVSPDGAVRSYGNFLAVSQIGPLGSVPFWVQVRNESSLQQDRNTEFTILLEHD